MSMNLQSFLAQSTQKLAVDLQAALDRLPDDKKGWTPAETSRSALDQAAECAILNGSTVNLIQSRQWPDTFDFEAFIRDKQKLAADPAAAKELLQKNTQRVADAIKAVADADLEIPITTPFGTMSLAQIMSYPYWNMSYHEGQINYIASILGCLA